MENLLRDAMNRQFPETADLDRAIVNKALSIRDIEKALAFAREEMATLVDLRTERRFAPGKGVTGKLAPEIGGLTFEEELTG